MVKTFHCFEVWRGELRLARFVRLIDAVRFWREHAKDAKVVRVSEFFDGDGRSIEDFEILID